MSRRRGLERGCIGRLDGPYIGGLCHRFFGLRGSGGQCHKPTSVGIITRILASVVGGTNEASLQTRVLNES
jgi:hypothetical protein